MIYIYIYIYEVNIQVFALNKLLSTDQNQFICTIHFEILNLSIQILLYWHNYHLTLFQLRKFSVMVNLFIVSIQNLTQGWRSLNFQISIYNYLDNASICNFN